MAFDDLAVKTEAAPRLTSSPAGYSRKWWLDLIVAALLIAGAAFWFDQIRSLLPPSLFSTGTQDVWFNADIGPVTQEALSRLGPKPRSSLHPMFPFVTVPLVQVVSHLGQLAPIDALNKLNLVLFVIWPVCLYGCLRLLKLGPLEAAVFSCLGLSSSATVFFLTVPLYYGLGSISLMLAFACVMIARTAAAPDILMILANTLSLSITVTNWMFGLIATFLRLPIRRAIQVALNGFALLSLFWIVGHIYVPGAVYIGPTLFEKTFVYVPTLKRVAGVLLSFAGYSMVAPTANDFITYNGPRGLSVQGVWPSLDLTGCILLAWFVLLGYGCWASYRLGERFVFRLLTAWLAGQLILHTVYGEETFLYSLHWTPFLIMTAAAGCRGRMRVPAVVFAALLAIMSGFSNYTHLHAAIKHLVTIGSLK